MSFDKDVIEQQLLQYIADNNTLSNTIQYVDYDVLKHQVVVGVMKSLEVSGCLISSPADDFTQYKLTDEAQLIIEQGSHEVRFFNLIQPEVGSLREEILEKMGQYGKIAMGSCMKNKWIRNDGKSGMVYRLVDTVVDNTQQSLQQIISLRGSQPDAALNKTIADLKKRRLVDISTIKTFSIQKGQDFSLEKKQLIADLDVNMLKTRSWESGVFKDYNYAAEGKQLRVGSLHPLQKIKIEFTHILTNMGFSEMPTNQYVESSFWNFDTLFQPQQHPARDAHDTFFLDNPSLCDMTRCAPEDYIERVKNVHEVGGYDSLGYHYDWSADEASKNILRTHTTACSSRVLYQIAQEYKQQCAEAEKNGQEKPEFPSRRYFSIDRVFRNETLDATHLAEFHQVEGMIVGKDLTLGNLIAVIKTFFEAIGVDDVKFKPAFNPYTEPSMEIFGFSKELNKWVEIGNSGVFRPEMVEPMGIPSDVRVIAWGLSLERPTMIKYGLKNIRDLVGPKMQLRIIEKNPIARYP